MINHKPTWAPKPLFRNTIGVPEAYENSFTTSNKILHRGSPWITSSFYVQAWTRLLTHSEMKYVYEKLRKIKPGFKDMWEAGWKPNANDSGYDFLTIKDDLIDFGNEVGFAFFEEMINNSLFVQVKNEVMTFAEKEEWAFEVEQTALKLERLINNSSLDELSHRYDVGLGSLLPELISNRTGLQLEHCKKIQNEIKTFFPDQKPSKIINEIRKQVKVEAFSDNRNKRPNDDNFRRTYFIRKLSKNFETYCGGKNVKLVTIIANSVFDSSISERQVRNTIRTVD